MYIMMSLYSQGLSMIESQVPDKVASSWLLSPSSNKYIWFCQRIGFWISKAAAAALGAKRHGEFRLQDLDPAKHYVIAGNHQSRLDPFMLGGQFKYAEMKRLETLRLMTLNYFLDAPVFKHLTLLLGCFPAKVHPRHPFGLAYAEDQLSKGRTVIIFPEGRRSLPAEYPARSGVAVLAKLPDVMIIPAHVQWRGRGWKHGFDINIGKPFDGSKMTAQEILDHIYSLPLK
jgi:1-acyl-sn-glycerol-3-phosphate acyltransferase